MLLGDLAWPEAGEYLDGETLALLPTGSTEQHGPALPLSTDHRIATAFARAAAERTDRLCGPTVPVGVSPHHRQFPGTASVDAPAFRNYVESLVRGLADQGVDRVVFVNAHGGNVEHLREVGRRVRDDGTAYALEWMWDESIAELVDDAFVRNGPHAGPKETALLMHLAPELVHEDRLAAARDGGCPDVDEGTGRRHGARTYYDSVENSPNGAFGDPTEASAADGERLFEAALAELVALVEWLDDQPFEALAAPGPVTDREPPSHREP